VVLVGSLSGIATAAGVYYHYASQLEGELERLETRQLFETTKIYDRTGEHLLYEVFEEGRRTRIDSLDQVPPHLISATIAIEDKTFWENPGIDLSGIARAALDNAVNFLESGSEFEIAGGGSTLTQQFIKNALFDYEYRISPKMERKIKEAILSLEMTRTYDKEEILLMYFNEIAYGNLSYGIEAAAQGYFGKSALELNLPESALLAGLPQSPTLYNPLYPEGFEYAKTRQWDVLRRMVEDGYITQEEAEEAYNEELVFARPEIEIDAPHFVMYVRRLLENDPDIGPELLYGGGLTVRTSIDMRYQRLAEAVVRERMGREDMAEYNAHNAALVSMRPDTGEILAMVGSVDYNLIKPSVCEQEGNVVDGNVNAALADRQPGSSFKPITYLTAFTKGWYPSKMVLDIKTEYPVPGHEDYIPENYNKKVNGPVMLRNALGSSLNIPAVKVIQYAGVGETIDMAHRLGITGLQRGLAYYGLSLTLGGGEVRLLDMVNSYSTLANEGRFVPPVAILEVTDAYGEVVKKYDPEPLEERAEVVDPRFVYLVLSIMTDDGARQMAFGAHSILDLGPGVAVKTGTSEDWGDNWTIGFSPYLATGVWVGNNNNEPMTRNCTPREYARSGIPGSRSAGHIWRGFMEAVIDSDHPDRGLARYFPDEEVRAAIFGDGEMRDILRDEEGDLRERFRRPRGVVEMEVCLNSGYLPNGVCPVTRDLFVEGYTPREVDTIYKAVTVVQIPGADPPQYCLPVEGVEYPPELVQSQVYMDLESIAKPEERTGLEEFYQGSGFPRPPTWYCTPDLGTPLPGEPGGPKPPPANRWNGLTRSITFPVPYYGVSGPIEVRGSADLTSEVPGDQFAYYKVEWGHKGALSGWPTEWFPVGESNVPVHDGVLAYWDPGMLPDGSYALRLTVVTKDGQPRFNNDQPGHSYVPVYLDRGPVYVRMLSPQGGTTLPYDQVTLVAKVEGVSPARRVDFFYDGIFVGSAVTNTVYALSERVYTVTWSVRPGQHILTVQVVNMAGKEATSQQVLIIGRPPEGSLPSRDNSVTTWTPPPKQPMPPPDEESKYYPLPP
jgi:peptidoglycan glycosyltransferase